MAYEKQTWTDGTEEDPGKGTRINAERMEHIEDGIYNADQESSAGISDLQEAIDDLKKVNEDQDSEIEEIKKTNKDQDPEIEEIKKVNEDQDSEIEEIKKVNEDQDSALEETNKNVSQNTADISSLNSAFSDMYDDIADITDEEIEALFEDDEADTASNSLPIER